MMNRDANKMVLMCHVTQVGLGRTHSWLHIGATRIEGIDFDDVKPLWQLLDGQLRNVG